MSNTKLDDIYVNHYIGLNPSDLTLEQVERTLRSMQALIHNLYEENKRLKDVKVRKPLNELVDQKNDEYTKVVQSYFREDAQQQGEK